jgi:16S rRNA (cytidine1402-2'-O)-methyltransferase
MSQRKTGGTPSKRNSRYRAKGTSAPKPVATSGKVRDGAGAEKPSPRGWGSKPAAAPGLYIVATPIGNLGDVTLRALDILDAADVIACEDTRVTGKLRAAHGISTPMTPYHEHNAERARPKLIERLKRGEIVALVSDAGTPLVSDPGYRLVQAAIAAGINVTAAPGATAPIAALVVAGLPTDRFLFAGFLPPRPGPRRRALDGFAAIDASLIFLEAPRRLAASLADMADALGARPAAVAREMTKLHEEVRRGTLAQLAAHYRAAGAPRGEAVVVVAPPPAPEALDRVGDGDAAASGAVMAALDALLREALGRASVRDAATQVAGATGIARRRVYRRALELAGVAAPKPPDPG